ncbi:MAG: trypsin-like peptidase domain-containing protein [Eubacterium sp.]|nr:trypsin-like peptidase domain-containing protein [Eubacterium sp.]
MDEDFGTFSYGKSTMKTDTDADSGSEMRNGQDEARRTAYRPEPYEAAAMNRTTGPAFGGMGGSQFTGNAYGAMGAEAPRPGTPQNIPPAPTTPKKKAEKKSSGNGRKFLLTAALALVFGVIASGAFIGMNKLFGDKKEETVASTESGGQSVTSDNIGTQAVGNPSGATQTVSYDVAEIVKKAQPSTVSITTTVSTSYEYFFQQYERESKGAGSGIIIGKTDEYLYIATNYHVIENAKEINVGFNDGQVLKAKVTGYDSSADVAVVQVPVGDIPEATAKAISVAVTGDSDALQVGEPAIAIGNALGYGQSVTVGYISALERSISGSEGTYIQTDAAINPGNSGGALFNAQGQVIGINSVKYVDSKVEGMGFSIPINKAMGIINNLIQNGTKGKVYIGISGATITQEYSQIYGFPMGVYIKNLTAGGPAEKAGLHAGDIIVAVDDHLIETMDELTDYLQKYNAGDSVKIAFQRTDSMGRYTTDSVTVKVAQE